MSFQAMAWAVKQDPGDPLAKLLLLMMANYADERGECYPSLNRLTADTGMARRSVVNKLDVLEAAGFITRRSETTRTGAFSHNVYTLQASASRALGVQEVGPPSAPGAPEPIREPITSPPPTRAKRLDPEWEPKPEDLAWAQQAFPAVELAHEVPKFRDHWVGTGEARADWNATFRNWVRRSARDYARPVARGPGADRTADNARRVREFLDHIGDSHARPMLDVTPRAGGGGS